MQPFVRPAGSSLYRKGIVFLQESRFTEALAEFRAALALDHHDLVAWGAMEHCLFKLGRVQECVFMLEKAVTNTLRPDYWSALLFCLNILPKSTSKSLFRAARAFALSRCPESLVAKSWSNKPGPRKLKIGYVSPDFYDHVLVHFIEPVLKNHDRDAFELHAFAEEQSTDAVTERLKGYFTTWINITRCADVGAARLVKGTGIDILVDLAGHTKGNRLGVFAYKQAPVQVTMLGYPGTTGLSQIDWRITDEIADPPDQDKWHSERLYRLPGCAWCYQPRADAPAVSPAPCLKNGYITFGVFQSELKIHPRLITLWVRVLKAVPNARLVFKNRTCVDPGYRRAMEEAFYEAGLRDGDKRLTFWQPPKDAAAHLSLYGEMDIALDAWPYSGTTTTCEAAWQGVPTITLTGDRHISRVSTRLNAALQHEYLNAPSEDAYVATAISLAAGDYAQKCNREMRRKWVAASSLCDGAAYTRKLEAVYKDMWAQWSAKR